MLNSSYISKKIIFLSVIALLAWLWVFYSFTIYFYHLSFFLLPLLVF
ncbi:hypothetical protein HanHA89_Chr03g0115921 [Helianthus annuus]|nr:hypothetical protein HanHA89_Chr03g0115921 [Helianthus annuus]